MRSAGQHRMKMGLGALQLDTRCPSMRTELRGFATMKKCGCLPLGVLEAYVRCELTCPRGTPGD